MGKFINEFKEFINKGNAMDMAVGVIIGGAFTAIVTSLTTDILTPVLNLMTSVAGGADGSAVPALVIPVPGSETGINISAFIGAIVNFLIMAFVVFLLVKGINGMANAGKKLRKQEEEEEAAPAPTCPYCLEEVKEGATRCPHCAGDIAAYVAPEETEAE